MSKWRKGFICMVLMLIISINIKTEVAYANETASMQEELEDYDLSKVEYQLFDGKEYYPCSKEGVTYNGRAYKVVVKGLPNGVKATCTGDKQINAGEYKVTIKFSNDNKHNPNIYLMDLISLPCYDEIVSKSPIPNPNPDPSADDDYCSRYDFKCKICGLVYSCYNDHKFVDGVCSRTFCSAVEPTNEINELVLLQEAEEREVSEGETLEVKGETSEIEGETPEGEDETPKEDDETPEAEDETTEVEGETPETEDEKLEGGDKTS